MDYHYKLSGRATPAEQTWTVEGTVAGYTPGDFRAAIDDAIGEAFYVLTEGKAVYGKPGLGCSGPYRADHFSIDLEQESGQ